MEVPTTAATMPASLTYSINVNKSMHRRFILNKSCAIVCFGCRILKFINNELGNRIKIWMQYNHKIYYLFNYIFTFAHLSFRRKYSFWSPLNPKIALRKFWIYFHGQILCSKTCTAFYQICAKHYFGSKPRLCSRNSLTIFLPISHRTCMFTHH